MALRSLLIGFSLGVPLAAQVTGSWTLISQPDLPALIEESTATLRPAARIRARDQLKKNNPVCRQITIAHAAGHITIGCGDHRPQRMPDTALAVPWVQTEGQPYWISARMEGADLVQILLGEDGMRKIVFRANGGVLTLRVTVRAAALPKPFTYALTYRL